MKGAYHVMLKPRGPICDLDCAYCYYLGKEELYPGSDFRMDEEVLESFTRQYLSTNESQEVVFGWQGGEPLLMGRSFFERAVELQEEFCPPGVRTLNTIQTNGTHLDNAWCRFLRERGFLVGLSLDGPRRMHDAYRVDRAGEPTFGRVMEALDLLQKHGVEFNILTTVHAANAQHPGDVYRFLRDEAKARFIQFIPIVERSPDGGVSDRSVRSEDYGRFLIEVFEEWVRHDVGMVFVQIFDVALSAWMGRRPGLCIFEETCGNALALEHNGDLYACDHFVVPEWLIGNTMGTPLEELVASDRQRSFGEAKRDDLPRWCRACEVRFVCNGGCPRNRFITTPDGEAGLNYLCEGYRAFFNHIDDAMNFMAYELRAGRPPAGIMRELS